MTIPALMPTYARFDVAFERGEGARLFDTEGRSYLDFATGIAVSALGHGHPRLVKAIQDQAGKVLHTSNLYRIPGQEAAAEKLVANTFADTVFFGNSGAEALELCLKIARRFHQTQGAERHRVIVARNAFHGRTLATIAAGGQEKHLAGFGPIVEGFDRVAFGNMNEARNAVTDKTAAVLVEPVQGEGGILPADADYMRGLRTMCDEYGLLLMFDEVQTGNGRTGKLYAHQWSGITPDVMATAKGLGGGFPVGAVLATERAASCMTPGTHGTTYGGNPLAMAAVNAVLDTLLADGFLENVQAVAAHLRGKLSVLAAEHPAVITDVRGLGLMLGLKLADGVVNTEFVGRALKAGLLTVPAGDNVVRLLPPLIIGEAEADAAVDILFRVCQDTAPAS
jgi:acetylornithine/N-succinyldiaminopimelate aminotransferase